MSISTNPIALDETLKMTNEKLEELANAIENEKVSMDIPIATKESLGAVKIGENLEISEDGTLSSFAKATGYTELNFTSEVEYNNVDNPLPTGDNEYLQYETPIKELYEKLRGKEGFFCGVITFIYTEIKSTYNAVIYYCFRYECEKLLSNIPNDKLIEDYTLYVNPMWISFSAISQKTYRTDTKRWSSYYNSESLYNGLIREEIYVNSGELARIVSNISDYKSNKLINGTELLNRTLYKTDSTGFIYLGVKTLDLKTGKTYVLFLDSRRLSDDRPYGAGMYLIQTAVPIYSTRTVQLKSIAGMSYVSVTAGNDSVIITPSSGFGYKYTLLEVF